MTDNNVTPLDPQEVEESLEKVVDYSWSEELANFHEWADEEHNVDYTEIPDSDKDLAGFVEFCKVHDLTGHIAYHIAVLKLNYGI